MKKKIYAFIILLFVVQLSAIFGKNKIQNEVIEWSVIKTIHFDIFFEKGNDEFGKTAALMSEEAYYYLKEDFRVPIKRRIPIIFYSTNQDFETTNIIPSLLSEGVGGFTESRRNRVAIPFGGSYLKMEETLIHELTHAYVNEINNRGNNVFGINGLPFWFSEGLPEFLSIGGKRTENNVYVIDLIYNDRIPDFSMLGGFYAYRLGELFLTYIGEEYGRDKVMDLFYALRYSKSADLAIKKVFDMEFDELQHRWINYLIRKYSRYMREYDVPYEVYEQLTHHTKDGSSMNVPAFFIPGTSNYLFFSDLRIHKDIWMNSILDPHKPFRIIKGETSGKVEEFHFQKNNLDFFPDADRFAFVAKTSVGDQIQIASLKAKKIVESIKIDRLETIYEIDISADGKKITFAGQHKFKSNIYVYDIGTKKLDKITDDRYYAASPKWNGDGTKIAFSCERNKNNNVVANHLFYQLSEDIFYYDLSEKVFYQVTNDLQNNSHPIWGNNYKSILFLSEDDISSNYEIINLENGKRARVTNSLGSVASGDLNEDNDEFLLSCFYDKGWDLYLLSNPLENLEYMEYQKPVAVNFLSDFDESFELEKYMFFGEREREFKKELPEIREDITRFEFGEVMKQDSLARKFNYELDAKPTETMVPQISDYKTRFFLDNLWGGMAYSPDGGTYAQVQFSLSDLMGDKGIGVNLGISGELKNSSIMATYMHLARRTDYGIGGLYLNDSAIYQFDTANGLVYGYLRERQRDIGVMGTISYPFNKFWRLDFDAMLYRHELHYDWTYDLDTDWIEDFVDPAVDEQYNIIPYNENVASPQFTLNFDNAIYGSTGPISGWKSALILQYNLTNSREHSLIYADVRKYYFFNKRYALAFRAVAGEIFGDTDTRFDLDYYDGVRGFYDENLIGERKIVFNSELRFPFLDNVTMAFPLPIFLNNIRGSAFVDLGTVWDKDDELDLYKNGAFDDLKVGFGFGPRVNLGYFVVKLDIAWNTDLNDFSRPSYYFSLSPDF